MSRNMAHGHRVRDSASEYTTSCSSRSFALSPTNSDDQRAFSLTHIGQVIRIKLPYCRSAEERARPGGPPLLRCRRCRNASVAVRHRRQPTTRFGSRDATAGKNERRLRPFGLPGGDGLADPLMSVVNTVQHAVRREHCTSVKNLALSGYGALDARGSFALITSALLGVKRGKKPRDKVEEYTTYMQVDLKQTFEKSSFYSEQLLHAGSLSGDMLPSRTLVLRFSHYPSAAGFVYCCAIWSTVTSMQFNLFTLIKKFKTMRDLGYAGHFNEGRKRDAWEDIVKQVGRSVKDVKKSSEPMGVIEVSMKHRRNEGTGETGDHLENPLPSGITRHDSHMQRSGSDPAGD
ncbi:hypothetical protein PR048_008317 [Dryococelus australis]|uniref:Uncharacterized protein n=1 Tax=Dryococelus australis TaxID=614101 RepID=A0ABQ9HWS6_9NEOP|nr:hypothetical protein PR048_008317 [Dryococelus australis]